MSEGKQHYIPRFLLNGFSKNTSKNNYQTWIYRKGKHFPININDIASENHFYDDTEAHDVDNKIGTFENKIAPLINNKLRNEIIDDEILKNLPYIVANFGIRTKWIRDEFAYAIGRRLDITSEILKSSYLLNAINDIIYNNKDYFNRKIYPNYAIKQIPQDTAWDMWQNLLKSGDMNNILKRTAASYIKQLNNDDIRDTIKAEIKKGHISALNQSLTPNLLVDNIVNYKYKFFNFNPNEIIIGDSILLWHTDNNTYCSIPDEGAKHCDYFIFPLKHDLILVGYKDACPKISLSDITHQTIAGSFDFFASSVNSETLRSKSVNICTLHADYEIAEIRREMYTQVKSILLQILDK